MLHNENPVPKKTALDRLKEEWNENPLKVIAVVGLAAAGMGRFLEALGSIPSKLAYAKMYGKK